MRIIHAHKYFYLRAGAERYMLSLMSWQERLGHTVAPFSMQYSKNDASPWSTYFVSELKTENGRARGLGAIKQFRRALWSKEAFRKMDDLIQVFHPDIVHVHNIYTHLSPSALAACAQRRVPVVMTVHDYALLSANYSLWNKNRPMNKKHLGLLATSRTRFIKDSFFSTLALDVITKWHRLRRAYDRRIDRYLVSTEFVKSIMVQHGFDAKKIFVEGLMVDIPQVEPPKQREGVVYVGRLEQYKGVETLIDAMKTFPKTALTIVGSGPFEHALRLRALGMENVHFLGFARGRRLQETIAGARVAVVPSRWYEPYGLAAVEAMALGTPVVVSDRGGLPELVEDGVSGVVFQAGNIRKLAKALKSFIHRPRYAEKIGKAAKTRAFQIANSENHVNRVIEHYREMIDE